jgi:hypothetical protein
VAGTLAVELKLEHAKVRRRRAALNRPLVEALVELEELSSLGVKSLETHEAKLQSGLDSLWEAYRALGHHHDCHRTVARAADRAKVLKPHEHATHEALRIAAEREDTCRRDANEALHAAKAERSRLMSGKSDVQRAMLARAQEQMVHKRMDAQGTTFRTWNARDLDAPG